MSSIGYISDDRMIEYHRINGNRAINFWRISIKSFENFREGDLVFFLGKKHIHPISREKGIVGFGRLKRLRTMSVKRTWEAYSFMNGFDTYESFEQAILSINTTLPRQIQSLELEDVMFLSGPIYASELGFPLNKSLESFTYFNSELEMKILEKSSELGMDQWYETVASIDSNENIWTPIITEQRLRACLAEITGELTQLQETMLNGHDDLFTIGSIGYRISNNYCELYFACSSLKFQIFSIIGMNEWIKKELEDVEFKSYICLKKSRTSASISLDSEKVLNSMSLKLLYI